MPYSKQADGVLKEIRKAEREIKIAKAEFLDAMSTQQAREDRLSADGGVPYEDRFPAMGRR